jgi:ADP-ribose pyrophosphatase
LAFENTRIRVFEDDVVQPDGSADSYTVIEEQRGAVAVIAVDDRDRIAVVRQHRYPIDATTLEIPAGEVTLGGDPIEHARRELAEEPGILAGRLRVIGRFAPWPARVRRYCDVVLADELSWSRLGPVAQE